MYKLRVQKVLDDYLFSPPSLKKRLGVKNFVSQFAGALPETVIFGGMLREFSLGKSRRFCSDLDLVTTHSRCQIERFLSDLDWTRNKFGGYRVFAHGWLYDVWSLEDTWAAQVGLVSCSTFEDLLETTFFDIDSAAFHISKRQLIASDRHVRAIRSKVLGINLAENPSPASMASRAVRMAMENELSMSRELAEYVAKNYVEDYQSPLEQAYLKSLRRLLTFCGSCTIRPIVQPDLFG